MKELFLTEKGPNPILIIALASFIISGAMSVIRVAFSPLNNTKTMDDIMCLTMIGYFFSLTLIAYLWIFLFLNYEKNVTIYLMLVVAVLNCSFFFIFYPTPGVNGHSAVDYDFTILMAGIDLALLKAPFLLLTLLYLYELHSYGSYA